MNRNLHTVEKIGGTSMTRFGELMENILIGSRKGSELYNRIFVVSAYGGVTNWLLEDKKTGEPGIYGSFAAGDNRAWQEKLEATRVKMIELNHSFADLKLDLASADAFVNERMNGIKNCLLHLMQLRSFGHFQPGNYLPAARAQFRRGGPQCIQLRMYSQRTRCQCCFRRSFRLERSGDRLNGRNHRPSLDGIGFQQLHADRHRLCQMRRRSNGEIRPRLQ